MAAPLVPICAGEISVVVFSNDVPPQASVGPVGEQWENEKFESMMVSAEDDDGIRMHFGSCCELLNWTPATVIIMLGRTMQVEEFAMQIDVWRYYTLWGNVVVTSFQLERIPSLCCGRTDPALVICGWSDLQSLIVVVKWSTCDHQRSKFCLDFIVEAILSYVPNAVFLNLWVVEIQTNWSEAFSCSNTYNLNILAEYFSLQYIGNLKII